MSMIRTSTTHPLRIDSVAVPGTAGLIGMTLCPGKVQANGMSGSWHRDLALDMAAIQAWGASGLISLMEPQEFTTYGVPDFAAAIPAGIQHWRLPIRDAGVPDVAWEADWTRVGPEVREMLTRGQRVAIHCLGGLGRTGLLGARLLVAFGMAPDLAIAAVRKAREGAIETTGQAEYVRLQMSV